MEKFSTIEQNNLEQLSSAVEIVSSKLTRELEQKFSSLEYHNLGHSIGVSENALHFLKNEPISEADLLATKVAGLGHDIDQSFTWEPAFSGVGLRRVRDTGVIEASSAEYVLAELESAGLSVGTHTKELILEAILGTVPMYDPELKTVTQPNVSADSKPSTWAIAAADLATSGFNSQNFLRDGDAVWNEDRTLPDLVSLSDEEKTTLHDELLAWSKNQISYAEGQRAYWNRDVVPDFIKDNLNEFDQSISLCKERYLRRASMTLDELLDDMGFSRFKKNEK